jgi:NAD-dependent dihydropyrimidine dehydrogenase PreA subunit
VERDLQDIGAGKEIPVHALKCIKYGHRISGSANGRIKNGIIFSTYACLIAESHSRGEYQTRMDQILKWCHHDFYGVIVFDECYQAKNCVPICSGTAKKVTKGQDLICICNWSLGTTPPRVYGPIGTIQWYTRVLHSMVRRFQLREERYILTRR